MKRREIGSFGTGVEVAQALARETGYTADDLRARKNRCPIRIKKKGIES